MAHSIGRVTNLGLPIPDKILDTINDQRQSAMCNIIDSLHQRKEKLLNESGATCYSCNAASLGNLMMEMNSNGILSPSPTAPFLGISLSGLEAKVRSFKDSSDFSRSCLATILVITGATDITTSTAITTCCQRNRVAPGTA